MIEDEIEIREIKLGHGKTDVSCRHGSRWIWWNPDPDDPAGKWEKVIERCDCDCTDPPLPFVVELSS